jgi:hypothetical protein
LFVGGSSKSGSTLLGALLGRVPALLNLGEVNLFWSKRQEPSERCGCGAALATCPFWTAVVGELEHDGVDPERMAALATRLDHTRALPRVLGRRLSAGTAAAWAELATGTANLYRAAYRRSGANYLVDGSKLPTHLLLLRESPAIDLRVLHLIRDGRAVAWSWERKRRRARAGSEEGSGMRRHGSVLADLAIWHVQNFAIDALARRCPHSTRLQYEAMAADPAAALHRALGRLGIEHLDRNPPSDRLGASCGHAIGGNDRVRFAGEDTPVTVDEAWRRELRGPRLRLWSLLAAPGLRRFGYPVWRARRNETDGD